jgi:hypothetical protein
MMKLNSTTITKLNLPDGKTIYFDDDLGGFGIRLRASGDRVRKTWVAQYRAHGRTRRMKIGSAEKITAPRSNSAKTRKARRRPRG